MQRVPRDEFLQKRSDALALFREGTTTEEILKEIYIDSLEDKTDMQAEVMAQHIIETVSLLSGTYDGLKKSEGSVAEWLDFAFDDFSPEQKAEKLMSVSCVFENIDSLAKKDKLNTAPFAEEFEKLKKKGIDEASINALLNRAAKALSSENTAKTLLGVFAEQTKEEANGIELTDNENDPRTLIAVDSMIIYTMVVNGRIEGIKKDTSLFEITAGIWLGNEIERLKLKLDESKGRALREIRESLGFLLVSLIIAAVVFCVAAPFLGPEVAAICALCVFFYSARLIMLAQQFFYSCSSCDVSYEIPLVKFPELECKTRDRIKNHLTKKIAAQESENSSVDLSEAARLSRINQELRVNPGDPDSIF